MGKTLNVKKTEILKLEFEDNTYKECKFSAYAMFILDEEFEGFQNVFKQAQEKPFSAGAKLLYAGMRACDDNITFDDAKVVVSNLDFESILTLFEFATETIEVKKEKKQKVIPQDHKHKKK